MDIATRMTYVQQHIAALSTDIDSTQADCFSALQSIAAAATAAANQIIYTRDDAITARRAASAAKEARRNAAA